MNLRRTLLILSILLAILFLYGVAQVAAPPSAGAARRSWSREVREALRKATAAFSGPGVSQRMMGSAAATSKTIPADRNSAGIDALDPGIAETLDRTHSTDAAETDEQTKKKLQRITLREGEAGERNLYGKGKPPGTGRGSSMPTAPDEAALIERVSSFLHRLNQGEDTNPSAKGLGGPGSRNPADEKGSSDEQGSIAAPEVESKYSSPTLEALQKVRNDSANSLRMIRKKGEEDGSKDRGGTGFDGNPANQGVIPLIESEGAFGQKVLRSNTATD